MSAYQTKDIAGILAKSFLRNPLTPILGFTLLAIGYLSLLIMPREENPQMVVSGSSIIVVLPGASAKEVEEVIVKPMERKLKEIKGIDHIVSMARDNMAIVNAAFIIGEQKEESNLKIYDKIMQNQHIFPEGTLTPIIKPLDIDIDIPILSIAFYSTDPNMDATTLTDKVKQIQHNVNALENVAVTNIKAGRSHQFNIQVDLHKLSAYNLSLGQIVTATQALAYNVPTIKNQVNDGTILMLNVKNAIESVKDIENIIVAQYMGSAIHLRDIASVNDSDDRQHFNRASIFYKTEHTAAFENETAQVTLTVSKLQGSNAVNIANAVLDELTQRKDTLHNENIGYVVTRNDGERANAAVNELVFHLILSIIIIALLLVFVLGWRESLIVTFTVPAILAITLFVAYLGGQTINRITLFAFLLSLGLLVDAAIIVIENIHRHLHSIESKDESMQTLVVKATDEIGAPTNIATLAIILTMVPMAFVGQMMGQFMKPIPANVPVALIASLVVAYIFTPYLALRLLNKKDAHV